MKYKRPAYRKQAVDIWFSYIGDRMNGSSKTKYEHRKRMAKICSLLYRKYQIDYRLYRVKHFRAILDTMLKDHGVKKVQDYYRTIFQMSCLMDKENNWLPYLKGPWVTAGDSEGSTDILAKERKPTKRMPEHS